METFTWRSVGQPAGTVTLRTISTQLGDGYSQDAGDGINNEVNSWPLQFAGSEADMLAIIAFLRARGGYQGFLWTPPLGVQGIYKCTSWSPTPQGGDVFTVSATFQQKFSP